MLSGIESPSDILMRHLVFGKPFLFRNPLMLYPTPLEDAGHHSCSSPRESCVVEAPSSTLQILDVLMYVFHNLRVWDHDQKRGQDPDASAAFSGKRLPLEREE